MDSQQDKDTHEYICMKCNQKVVLKSNSPIICNFCHYRILKKPRTEKIIRMFAV